MATTDFRTREATAPRTAWLAGLAVGVGGFFAVFSSGAGFSVSDDLPIQTMVDKLDAVRGTLLISGGLQGLAAMALVIYGAFVCRVLKEREPESSLVPTVAFGGALLAAAMAAFGGAATQLAGSLENSVDPAIPLAVHVFEESLFAGAWCSVALIAGALAVAGLRRGAVPRWFAAVSAFVAVLLVVAQVVVPWAGWFPAIVWIAISAVVLRERNA